MTVQDRDPTRNDETSEALRLRVAELEAELAKAQRLAAQERVQAARADAILDVAIDAILTVDEHGTVEFANPATERLFGYAVSELRGQNVKCLVPEPYRAAYEGYIEDYRRTGQSSLLGSGRPAVARRKDGSLCPVELTVTEFRDGPRRLFAGMMRDVSERRRAEEDARENHSRLRAILDSAVDGIIAIDEAGTILDVNPAVEAIFGYDPAELLGENVRVLMPSPYREEHDAYLEHYLDTGERRIIGFGREVRGLRKDGSIFPLYLAVSEGYVEHQRVFTGIVRDLGALREVEERAHQAEQLAALSTITAGIAHDVGTPMTTILGYAELLEASIQDEKNRERARHIVAQVRRVTDLLKTLLNIARPRRSAPGPTSVVDVLDHSVEFFREKLKGRGIIVERDYAATPTIVVDRDRLEQVFLNLIVNAADAMPSGGTLSVRVSMRSPMLAEISIEDTGIGIEAEILERIFDAFYTTKERGKGTGLGLLVSQQIIRDHGGKISVDSAPGKGTRFSILLPVAESAAGQAR